MSDFERLAEAQAVLARGLARLDAQMKDIGRFAAEQLVTAVSPRLPSPADIDTGRKVIADSLSITLGSDPELLQRGLDRAFREFASRLREMMPVTGATGRA